MMQRDGNLVLRAPGNRPIWASDTDGKGGAILMMQRDGNLVVIAPGNKAVWDSGTDGHPGTVLLQSDGNLVLYAPGHKAIWETGTGSGSGQPSGSYSCPVAGSTSFSDTYGAPRSGGRRHQGVDMFAREGIPVVAVTAGVTFLVENVDDDTGGISLWIRATDGDTYFYAHNSRNAVTSNGVRVSRGQVVGYVGRTGNARCTSPHLHFEIHPGGGAPVNPTPYVSAWC